MKKFSDKTKSHIKSVWVILLCVFVISWGILSGIEMWLNATMIDYNTKKLISDIHTKGNTIVKVSYIDKDGSFLLQDDFSMKKYTQDDDVKQYIRVRNGKGHYYDTSRSAFFAELTSDECRQLVVKFVLLDIVSFIILMCIVSTIFRKNRVVKVLYIIFVCICIFLSYISYCYAFETFFNSIKLLWVVPLIKLIVFIIISNKEVIKSLFHRINFSKKKA